MDISMFFTQSASVEQFLGAGPDGDLFAAAVTVLGFLDDGVMREQAERGEQLVTRTKFYCDLAEVAKFVPESRVTVNGRVCQVNFVRRRDASAFGGPSHLEVDLR